MANCNKLFLDFNKEISLSPTQIENLRKSRIALQDAIRKFIKTKSNVTLKGFYIQGSQAPAFKTTVLKSKDRTYDVDLGVYFDGKPEGITCTTLQTYILDAVKEHTDGGASHLKMCIRVLYAGAFDADLPVYYLDENGVPHIAVKNEGWRSDDQKGTSEWFREKKKNTKGQLIRIIKYLKAWADKDLRGFKMPSGFALTVWACNNFSLDETRDDKALLATLKAIKTTITNFGLTCIAPKAPYDDLVSNLDDAQKQKFRNALNDFITDAEKAVNCDNQLEASKLWQKHLGNRFKDGVDENVNSKEKQLQVLATIIKSGNAKTDANGNIQTEKGVDHQKHRNHGS